jgi:SHAQKYF class myb-like DNA-binding protein
MINNNHQILVNSLFPNKISIQIIDSQINETNDSENKQKDSNYNTGRWTEEEHKKFVEGILKYGNEWKKVQNVIKTRSSTQARSHAQKFFLRIKKDLNLYSQMNKNISLNSEQNNSDDNFSIKYFFEILNENDNNKINMKNNKLSEQQKEKLLNFVSKFSNNNSNKENDKNNIFLNNGDSIKKGLNKKKVLKQIIFDIKKDCSIRNDINSKKKIDNIELICNNQLKKNDSCSTNSEGDTIFNGKKRELEFPEFNESFNINLFKTNFNIGLNNCNNCNTSFFNEENDNNLIVDNYSFYGNNNELKNYLL